ncbi:MAG TPA: YncE family protein [Acidobacteriaceae bacterium]|nr:YncE family protein [Acidobacteriaceae bacterium]
MRRLLLACLAFTVALAGCNSSHFPHYPSNYREYAYVTNSGSNTVTALDLVNLRQDRIMAVGSNPTGIAVNPKKNEVYAVNTGSGTVSVIDATRNRVVATITVHRKPYFISVNASGTLAYVANSGSNNISVLDLDTRREIRTIPVGHGPGLAIISPDGNTIVVTNRISGSVSIIDAKSYLTRAVFSGCTQATDVVILPNSTKAFVACSGSHQVMAIGLAQPQNPNQTLHSDRLLTFLDVGKSPIHLALKPDGGEIFVSNFDSDSISEINTYTNEVGGAYLVGAHPAFGIVSADNSLLWISNFNADTIGIYSIDDGTLIKPSIHVGAGPDSLAFSADGFFLLAVDAQSGDVSVIRTQSHNASGAVRIGSLFTMLPAGNNPSDIAVKAFWIK